MHGSAAVLIYFADRIDPSLITDFTAGQVRPLDHCSNHLSEPRGSNE